MSQTEKCSHCGSLLQEGMRFCWNCGAERKELAECAEQLPPDKVNGNQNHQSCPYTGTDRQPVNRINMNGNQNHQSRPYTGTDRQSDNRINMNGNQNHQSRPYTGTDRQSDNRINMNGNQNYQSRPYAGTDQQALNSAYANRNAERQRQRSYEGTGKASVNGAYTNRNNAQTMNVQRYKQEEMEHDWQQSWDRKEEDDGSFTLIQYVLIGIAVVLLMALVGVGVYWVLGKSTGNTGRRPNAAQERIETGLEETERKDEITILDDTRDDRMESQTEKQTRKAEEKQSEKQTEEKQTEKQTGKIEEKQTEKQTGKTEEKQSEKQTGKTEEKQSEKQNEKTGERQTEKQTEADGEIPEIEIISEDYYVIEAPAGGTTETDYSGGYIPESSQRVLTDADVVGMTYDDLQMAINEIYARHGRIFRSEAISSYFNSQPWYQGTVTAENFNEGVFNSVESQNIQFLLDKMGN